MSDAIARADYPRARLGSTVAWIFLAALLAMEAVLFHRHAVREVVWAYPSSHDQADYLDSCYESYESLRREGFGNWFLDASDSPTGALLQIEAPLAFGVWDASRMTALWVVFAHFALLQIVLFWVVAHRTHSWALAFVALGLLLGARAAFHEPGGAFDFRLDFVTLCLFGLFACLAIRSRVLACRGWSLVVGMVAAWTILFRFLTAPYLACIFGLVFVFLNRPRRRNLFAAGLACAALAGPALWAHRSAANSYYVGGHLGGSERFLRAQHVEAVGVWNRLTFYPKSVAVDHTGPGFLGLAAVVIAVSIAIRRRGLGQQPAPMSHRIRVEILFLVLCVIVPLAILTLDVDKSRVVGGILVVPLILLVALMAKSTTEHRRWVCALATFTLTTGLIAFIWRSFGHELRGRHRGDAVRLLVLYDRVLELSRQRNLAAPRIAGDSHADSLAAGVFNVMSYERHHVLLGARESLANTLQARSPRDIIAAIDSADFVLLTEPKSHRNHAYPFDQELRELHSTLVSHCESHFRRDFSIENSDRRIVLYAK